MSQPKSSRLQVVGFQVTFLFGLLEFFFLIISHRVFKSERGKKERPAGEVEGREHAHTKDIETGPQLSRSWCM
jgi:hypothetical protein